MPAHPAIPLTFRIAVALGGGYFATIGAVTLSAALLTAAGQPRSEAIVLSSMLGFVGFAIYILWAFAERKIWRVATFTLGAAALTHLLSLLILRSL